VAAPAGYAATSDPGSTAQPSPTPQATTTPGGTPDALELTLDPTSAHPGDTVTVSFTGWKSESCLLYFDNATQSTGSCAAPDGVLAGSLVVPGDATPNTVEPITACPTDCTDDNFRAIGSLSILPLSSATSQPTKSRSDGAPATKPPSHHKPQHQAATSSADHTTTLVAGGAVVVVIASVLGLLLLRRRPPTIGQPPDVTLVPHPDPGVVTIDPHPDTATPPIHARITIRLRPDPGHCRVEAMQR
jgi:hypothetical protein